jgi:hypothetical protein
MITKVNKGIKHMFYLCIKTQDKIVDGKLNKLVPIHAIEIYQLSEDFNHYL